MWSTNTLWFDFSIVMATFAFGNIYFGHFEEHKPKWKRALKVVVFSTVLVCISIIFGRFWFFSLLGLLVLIVVYIHAWWLPNNGVNGFTGEPREKYYELIGYKKT